MAHFDTYFDISRQAIPSKVTVQQTVTASPDVVVSVVSLVRSSRSFAPWQILSTSLNRHRFKIFADMLMLSRLHRSLRPLVQQPLL